MSSTRAACGAFSRTLHEKASSEVNLSKTTTEGDEASRAASRAALLLSGTEKHVTGFPAPSLSSASEAVFGEAEAPTDREYPALAKARSSAAVRTPAAEERGSGHTVERKSTDFLFFSSGGGSGVGGVGDSSAAACATGLFFRGVAGVALGAAVDANRLALEVPRPESACIGG
jgi:hypothetical protein